MEINFQYQRIVLRGCMAIPVWFVLAPFEYLILSRFVIDFVFILISIGITIMLAPRFSRILYALFQWLIVCDGKVYLKSNEVEFVFKGKRRSVVLDTITNVGYDQISVYGIQMDRITIEYNMGGKQTGFSIISPDLTLNERYNQFDEIYRRINVR